MVIMIASVTICRNDSIFRLERGKMNVLVLWPDPGQLSHILILWLIISLY